MAFFKCSGGGKLKSGILYYATPANYKKTTSTWNSGVGVSPNVGNDFYCALSDLTLD